MRKATAKERSRWDKVTMTPLRPSKKKEKTPQEKQLDEILEVIARKTKELNK